MPGKLGGKLGYPRGLKHMIYPPPYQLCTPCCIPILLKKKLGGRTKTFAYNCTFLQGGNMRWEAEENMGKICATYAQICAKICAKYALMTKICANFPKMPQNQGRVPKMPKFQKILNLGRFEIYGLMRKL